MSSQGVKPAKFATIDGERVELPSYRIGWLTRFVYSNPFELVIVFVIATNAVSLAMLTVGTLSPTARQSAELIDAICFYIYVAELILRIISYGTKPWMFFTRGWNIFDFVIIGLSPIFQGQTVVLRLLRLLRLVRVFRFLPDVLVLSRSIVKSLRPLASMVVLIGLLLFIYGMAGYYLFGEQAAASWGSIGQAMMTLFILLTLENFPVYLEEAMDISVLALPFFLSYVFIIVFTVLNVLIGIVLQAMDEARAEAVENERLKRAEAEAGLTHDHTEQPDNTAKLKSEIERLQKSLAQVSAALEQTPQAAQNKIAPAKKPTAKKPTAKSAPSKKQPA